jgi:glycosyltransferase involved in cell wall biosynthesis
MSESTPSGVNLSVILPARNEAGAVGATVAAIRVRHPDAEIIVVDDGSVDATAELARAAGATVLSRPYGMGNGAAIKTGARAARGEFLVFMDADGQHDAADIARLLEPLQRGYDMAVGARGAGSQASVGRGLANRFYNALASWITGHPIPDLTSGFRAVRAARFREFLHLLPNGFSYPTTCTMAFFRSAYAIDYLPIVAARRIGTSHIQPLRDGVRFLLIIFKIATLYSPMKLFSPVALAFFALGLGNYAYTFSRTHRFTNMSVLLLSAAVIVFLIGLISEQITNLTYKRDA